MGGVSEGEEMDVKLAMSPGWVLISFLSRLFGPGGGGTDVRDFYGGYCTNDTQIIDQLDLDKGYNKHRIPDLYINEMWEDPSLNFEHMNPCKQNLSLDDTILQKLWTPNTCFINSKQAEIHRSPFKNVFLMIYPNGTIWTNYRVKLTGPCNMHLERFPMDVQKCHLTFESFNYNTDDVRMKWQEPTPVIVFKKIELPDFTMVNYSTIAVEQIYPAGWWDELTVTFVFRRRYGWYILQGYIPTYLTIFISWISFYLGAKAIPARTMIGVNALLAMTFQFGNIIRNLPRVSYVKAIDVWMLSGMTFVFASLLELAVVGFLSKDGPTVRSTGRKQRLLSQPQLNPRRESTWSAMSIRSRDFVPNQSGSTNSLSKVRYTTIERNRIGANRRIYCSWACMCNCCSDLTPEKIDKISAILFPTCFFIFNVFYWGYYLSPNDDEPS